MSLFKSAPTLVFSQETLLTHKYIQLRPTKLGLILLVLSGAIWVGAVNYQVNVAYAVCFWLIGFIGVAALQTIRQLSGLYIQATHTDEVFAGNPAKVTLSIKNHNNRAHLLWWRSEQRQANHHWQRCILSAQMPIYQNIWNILTQYRGDFPRPLILHLASTAPFGLFYAECHLEWENDAIVYPAPLAHQKTDQHQMPDSEQTPQKISHHGDDIAYLNHHQEGASLQHIAWKVYAKRGELMDKVFDEPPAQLTHNKIISYKDYPHTNADKLASLLTYRVLQAEQTHSIYTLELPKLNIPPQSGQREKCLYSLALM